MGVSRVKNEIHDARYAELPDGVIKLSLILNYFVLNKVRRGRGGGITLLFATTALSWFLIDISHNILASFVFNKPTTFPGRI